jgi:hypothetical protein
MSTVRLKIGGVDVELPKDALVSVWRDVETSYMGDIGYAQGCGLRITAEQIETGDMLRVERRENDS